MHYKGYVYFVVKEMAKHALGYMNETKKWLHLIDN